MSTEQFEKYYKGELIGKEKTDFETLLADNPSTKEQYEVYVMQHSFLQTHQQKAMTKQSMDSVLEQFKLEHQDKVHDLSSNVGIPSTEQKRQSKMVYFIPAAVAAMLVLGLFIRPLFDNATTSTDNLYANYFNPESISLQTRSTNDSSASEAEKAFNDTNYDLAYQKFEKLVAITENTDPQLQFYQGVSALGANKLTEAKQTLEPLLSHSVFGAGANYYLALLNIKQDDITKAKNLLDQIPSSSSYYKTSQELLKKL